MYIRRLLTTMPLVCASTLLWMPSVTAATGPASPVPANAVLPDAPEPQSAAQSGSSSSAQNGSSKSSQTGETLTPVGPEVIEGRQTKRILGIVPNFRAVSADQKLPPDTPYDKFKTTFFDSFDYSAVIFAAGQAGVAQAQDSYPEFHQGAAGYGRYFWHTFADQTGENLFVEGILPAALHQDNRYYTLGRGGFVKRTAYSFTRVLITRNDAGNEEPNYSEVVGAGAASGVSSLYYPSNYRTWTKVGQRWLTSVIIDGVTFTAKEFWPDVNNAVFHQKD